MENRQLYRQQETNNSPIRVDQQTVFMRNMEHDIRTPFNGIYAMTDMLAAKETDPEKREILHDISSCAKELLDYCNIIFDYSKIDTGVIPLLDKKFDLRALIDSVVSMQVPSCKYKKLSISVNYGHDVPNIVIGDHYRLHRIILNLVSNAVKFTERGSIQILVKKMQHSGNSTVIRIYVKDTGIGIPTEKQQYIYEKFNRLVPSYYGTHQGAGLGLTIVKQFVEELSGEIDVSSQVDVGSTFVCTLPFKLPLVQEVFDEELLNGFIERDGVKN